MECIPYIEDLKCEIKILEKIRGNTDTLSDIYNLNSQISKKSRQLSEICNTLEKMSKNSIEYRLYLKILNGKTISEAVEKIAEENYNCDIKPTTARSIWNIYEKKLKKLLKND